MMSKSWPLVPIETTYLGLYDGPHATPKPSEEGPIFLGIKNITEDGRLDFSEIRHISESEFPNWTKRVVPQPGDIVFTYEATLNRYAIIPEGFRGCLGRRLALIRPNPSKVVAKYLFYYFFGNEWRRTIANNMLLGSTVDRIPLVSFPKFKVRLPPLPIQRQIASILSAYDDLVENNTRRIAILEEMARALYEEWFVKFRFPGHEQLKMVESEMGMIPEGWEVRPFNELAKVLSGGTPRTSAPDYWNGNIPFFTPKDDPGAFYVLDTEKHITEEGLKSCNSQLYPVNTIFITARGTVGKMALASRDMAMNQSCYALQGQEGISQLFLLLHTEHSMEYFQKVANGAVFATIIVDTFKSIRAIKPPISLINRFHTEVAAIFEQILNLLKKNANLRQTRDKLLPKLISGEIDVSSWVEGGTGEEEAREVVAVAAREPALVRERGPVESIDARAVERPSLWEEA